MKPTNANKPPEAVAPQTIEPSAETREIIVHHGPLDQKGVEAVLGLSNAVLPPEHHWKRPS